MRDLEESVGDTFQEKSPNSIRMEAAPLNPEANERQFGGTGVYDGSAISPISNRVPGSRVIQDSNNARRKGKGACWKGQSEANCAELSETPGQIANHPTRSEIENRRDDEYQVNWRARLVIYGAHLGAND